MVDNGFFKAKVFRNKKNGQSIVFLRKKDINRFFGEESDPKFIKLGKNNFLR